MIGIVLVTVFFITSSDSGSLVADHLTSGGGKLDLPVPQRVFWAIMEGAVAAVLLLGGELSTLQTAAVCTGLPFAVVLLLIIYALYVGYSQELFMENAVKQRLRRVEEEHRMAVAIEAAAEEDPPGERGGPCAGPVIC